MEVNANKPVGDPTQGPEKTQKVDRAKQEKREASSQPSFTAEESPGDRISLSDASRQALTELVQDQSSGKIGEKADLSEDEVTRISEEASAQLSQTNASISNDAIPKAIDLFT